MAIKINVTPEDVARIRPVSETGWFPCQVTDIKMEMNKKNDAYNFVVDFEVIGGPDKGCRARTWFSEKAISMIIPFLNAVGVDVPETGLLDFDIEPAKGRKLDVAIKPEDIDGRTMNQVKDYAVFGTKVRAA